MTTSAPATEPTRLRGVFVADAVLLDVGLIGEAEARRRVLALWRPGCRLYEVGPHWLLVLDRPTELRHDRGPGWLLRYEHDALTLPWLDGVPGCVTWLEPTGAVSRRLDELPTVDMSSWLDLSGLTVHLVSPCDVTPPTVTVPAPVAPEAPDLRAIAGISSSGPGWPSGRVGIRRAWWWIPLAAAVAAAVVLVVTLVVSGSGAPHRSTSLPRPSSSSPTFATTPPPTVVPSAIAIGPSNDPLPAEVASAIAALSGGATTPITPPQSHGSGAWFVFVIVVLGLFATRRVRRVSGRRATSTAGAARPRDSRLARLLLRTKGGARFASGRQLRYLRQLQDDFRSGNWDTALRTAIALNGTGEALTLRMPRPRSSLRLGDPRAPGPSAFTGPFVHQYLRDLYRTALTRLEAENRIDEAAFLQAEILADVRGAVSLLERSGKIETAARLAEARRLEAGLIVRLWWRAGDRERALTVARARGAFADGIARVAAVDAAAATSLRICWIHACATAGDHQGAVDAAWPDPELRPLAMPSLEAGLTYNDERAAWFLAHLLCLAADDEHVDAALELMASEDPDRLRSRDVFTATFAEMTAADATADRRLAGAALLSLLRDGRPAIGAKRSKRLVGALQSRADPVLAVDLPPIPARETTSTAASDLRLGPGSGGQQVHDAVVMSDGMALLALGESGLRLLTPNGGTAASWQRPAGRIVMADHGTTALVVHPAGRNSEIARLDLATRRLTEWLVLADSYVVDSFDGSVVTVVNADGITFLDALAPQPVALWHELDAASQVRAINRTPDRLTAWVHLQRHDQEPLAELWSWELPSMTLRVRSSPRVDRHDDTATVPGAVLSLHQRAGVDRRRLWIAAGWDTPRRLADDLPPDTVVESNGSVYLLSVPDEDGGFHATVGDTTRVVARVHSASDAPLHVHQHRDITTLRRADGRVLGIDTATGGVVVEHRTAF